MILNPAEDVGVFQVYPTTSPQSVETTELLDHIRDEMVPAAEQQTGATVHVGGITAIFEDFGTAIADKLPLFIGVVVLLSGLLLMAVFRSVLVPLKAIVMNLLSVGAAYGLIVLVFQKGGPAIGKTIADAFGFQQTDAIEAWLPLFLFSILFGLSMDYHVFLLTRIREEYDKTRDNAEAVTYGLRTTGGIITGAAIMPRAGASSPLAKGRARLVGWRRSAARSAMSLIT